MTTGAIELVTRSPEETRAVGGALARLTVPGDVISLTGDLGAGKTCLVQGAGAELGVTEPVSSPTFVLMRRYRGTMTIHHIDVYRLERIQEVIDLGFEDLLDPEGVVFVEWGDAIEPLLPEMHLEVELEVDEATDERRVVIRGRGATWARRWDRLAEELGQWRAA
jgi:tRNA threonylcarbamoyladenosine biosynthesis protein TsaE